MINEESSFEIDLSSLFHAIGSRFWIILAVTVLFAAIAASITYFLITPTYTATSTVYLLPRENEALSQTELQVGTQMTNDAAKLAKSKSVIEPVITDLKLDTSFDELSDSILVENPTDTRLIEISAKNKDPQLAADISNALSTSLCDQVATIMKTDRPTIAEKATAPDKPSAPNLAKIVLLATLFGVFISIAFVVLGFIRDDSIKSQEDVAKYLNLNVLAAIPMEYSDDNKHTIRKKVLRK